MIDPLGGDRQWLPLDQIPQQLIDATIAIEDRTFYTNQGFDMIGIGRAFNEYILQGGDIQGGSSITQQVVKNNLIEPERRIVGSEVGLDDYQRKLEEAAAGPPSDPNLQQRTNFGVVPQHQLLRQSGLRHRSRRPYLF